MNSFSIVWGFKHTMRNVAETALDTLKCLLDNMMILEQQEVAQQFYKQFLVSSLEHVLSVVSDSSQSQVQTILHCLLI